MVTDRTLTKAYKVLYDQDPLPEMENWQTAVDVLENWDVPRMGEDLARECVFQIVLETKFPDEDSNMKVTKRYVHDAEQKGVELFPEIGNRDPSMDLYAVLRNEYKEGQKQEQETIKENKTK